ncbi:hypothetical protein M5K25_001821 [Dendrobium thyrsiflorum]|uniref:Uncharacterized protein n=1 Tax=Dendrobium thyrsiflorum TaxID=117978 RepID=A0ABD0VRE9_DENTH
MAEKGCSGSYKKEYSLVCWFDSDKKGGVCEDYEEVRGQDTDSDGDEIDSELQKAFVLEEDDEIVEIE